MYKETKYKAEKQLLTFDENNAYTLQTCNEPVTNPLQPCNEPVTSSSTQDRLGKDRLGKDSISICADAPTPTPESKRRQIFIPPTAEQVQAYCKEHNKPIDVEAFISYYGSQGWKKANGQKLSSWELAVCQWYKRDIDSGKVKKTDASYKISDLEQASIDLYKKK
jgi:hypothetical protein